MSRFRPALAAAVLFLAACTRATTTAPAPATAPAPTIPAPATPVPGQPFDNWHLYDPATDHIPGIGLLRAQRELLARRQPQRTIIVAVIDNGVDTAHQALHPQLWANAREVPGNGRDDDNDGYVD